MPQSHRVTAAVTSEPRDLAIVAVLAAVGLFASLAAAQTTKRVVNEAHKKRSARRC